MLVDRVIKETTDVTREIIDLDEFLDPSEVVFAVTEASVTEGTPGWGLTPYPPAYAPPPYDPTPLILNSYTLDQSNRTLIFFVAFGTPGLTYTCTFVFAGTSGRRTTIEIAVEITGTPPVQQSIGLPLAPSPDAGFALPLAGGTMTGPLYLFEDPVYPTEAATKYYVDHVAGATGGPFLSLSGGIMTGTLELNGPPFGPLDAVDKAYVDTVMGTAGWLAIAGGTMTGMLTLAGDPQAPLDAAPKRYVDGQLAVYLPLGGGVMTGMLTLDANPTSAMQAATKQYVDDVLAGVGIQVTVGDTPPATPGSGDLWWDSTSGQGFIWFVDPTSSQWVVLNNFDYQSNTLPLTGGTLTGPLILAADPTVALGAATKQYVDAKVIGAAGVASFNSRTGAVVLQAADVTGVGGALLAAPVFTGDARAVTAAVGDNDTSISTTAFVQAAVAPALHNVGRSYIHNGLFNIAQRGAGPWTSGGYTLDRWTLVNVGDAPSISAVALADADRTGIGDEAAKTALQNVFTGNAAAGSVHYISQPTEDVRRLSGKTVTLSFWAKAAAGTPKLGLNLLQSFGTGGSPSSAAWALATGVAVTLGTTWARYSATIAVPSAVGKTLGTNGDSSTNVAFWYSSGATNNAIAGNIGVQSGTIQLWGIQLEVGSVATPLEKIDPQQDLAKCQRFYQSYANVICAGTATSASMYLISDFSYTTMMRVAPTASMASLTYGNATGLVLNAPAGNQHVQLAVTSVAAGLAWGQAGSLNLSADL
jgi:hypothetical protein